MRTNTKMKIIQKQLKKMSIQCVKTFLLTLSLIPARAHSQRPKISQSTPATLNYIQGRIHISGINTSNSKSKQSGLDAEIQARRYGIDGLEVQLKKSCTLGEIKGNWSQTIKSLGSEIFSDHTFKILLAGNIGDLIAVPTQSAEVITKENTPIVFRLPVSIPLSGTNCGVVTFQFSDSSGVRIFPTRSKKQKTKEGIQTVNLAVQKSGNLYAASGADKEVLKNSNIAVLASQYPNQILSLPVVP